MQLLIKASSASEFLSPASLPEGFLTNLWVFRLAPQSSLLVSTARAPSSSGGHGETLLQRDGSASAAADTTEWCPIEEWWKLFLRPHSHLCTESPARGLQHSSPNESWDEMRPCWSGSCTDSVITALMTFFCTHAGMTMLCRRGKLLLTALAPRLDLAVKSHLSKLEQECL